MYLLDNNIISELRKIKSGKANIGVIDWIKDKPKNQKAKYLLVMW